ncbi:MAG TPA: hypothetical protein VMU88_09025 [bacterium]|nr:hypothetical protein [bacterium]
MRFKTLKLLMAAGPWAFTPAIVRAQTAPAPVTVEWRTQLSFYGDNTEFFEPFRIRETILGQQFKSYLDVPTGGHTAFWAGLFADHRAAQDAAFPVKPILSFVYRSDVSKGILGALETVHRHGLIEPMEVTTLELTRPVEYGLQWIQKDNFIHLDSFLNWQTLLSPGQSEVFDYGGAAILPVAGDLALEGQLHGYHAGGAQFNVPVWNNLAAGVGLKWQADPESLGKTFLEVDGLTSKTTNLTGYPGPSQGYGLYAKGSWSPDQAWEFFILGWLGKDFYSREGDSNYNSVGTDGVYYQSVRHYEELGFRRQVAIENGVTFDFELRSHWIEDSWANSFRLVATVPFDVPVRVPAD